LCLRKKGKINETVSIVKAKMKDKGQRTKKVERKERKETIEE